MEPLVLIIVVLGAFMAFGYIRGRKTNLRISRWIGEESEAALRPRETHYVNIGGVIGYNFTYRMAAPFTEAKGTFTLLPRHSLLYLPVSLLIARHDRYYLHVYTDRRLAGEGHIIEQGYFPRVRDQITGVGDLYRGEAEKNGRRFVLLWDRGTMEERLRGLLAGLEAEEVLRHFCCYSGNQTFFVYSIPREERTGPLLSSIMPGLESFMAG